MSEEKKLVILVLARDYKSYARFVRKYNLHGKCRYVIDESDLKGRTAGTYIVVKYGDWFSNPFYYIPVQYPHVRGIRETIAVACDNAKEVKEVV